MSCVKTHPDNRYKTYRRRPRNIILIDGSHFSYRAIGSLAGYLWSNGIDIDPVLLRLMYAHIIIELVPNEFGKIPNELKSVYEDALRTISEYSNRYLNDWRYMKFLSYLRSADWLSVKEEALKIRNTKARLKFGFSQVHFLLEAYYRTPVLTSYFDLEQKYAGWSVKLWSKKSFWLSVYLFHETYLYIRNIEQTKNFIVDTIEWGENDDSLLLKSVRAWYENKGIEDPFYRFANKFYEFITNGEYLPMLAGEVGSVVFTSLVRRGVVSALSHLAHGLFLLASFHPYARGLSLLGRLAWIGSRLLDRSILAFFGWQIGLEWTVDGWIQSKLTNFLERVGFMSEKIGGLTKPEIKELVDLMIKLRKGVATATERQRFQTLLNKASPNLVNSIYNRLKMWEYVERIKGLKTLNETDLIEADLSKFKRYGKLYAELSVPFCSQKDDYRPAKFSSVVRKSDKISQSLYREFSRFDPIKIYYVSHYNQDYNTGSITPHLDVRYVLHAPTVLTDRRELTKDLNYTYFDMTGERYIYRRVLAIKRSGRAETHSYSYSYPNFGSYNPEPLEVKYAFGRFSHVHFATEYFLTKLEKDITRNIPSVVSLNPNTEKLIFDLLDEGYTLSKYQRKKVGRLLDYVTIVLEKPTRYLRVSHSRRCVSVVNAKKLFIARLPFANVLEITKERKYDIQKNLLIVFNSVYCLPDPLFSYDLYGNSNFSPANKSQAKSNLTFNHNLHRVIVSGQRTECRQSYTVTNTHTLRIYYDSDQYGNIYLVKEHTTNTSKQYHNASSYYASGFLVLQYANPVDALFLWDNYPRSSMNFDLTTPPVNPYYCVVPYPFQYYPIARYTLNDILSVTYSDAIQNHGAGSFVPIPVLDYFAYDFSNGIYVATSPIPIDYSELKYSKRLVPRHLGDNYIVERFSCSYHNPSPDRIITARFIQPPSFNAYNVSVDELPRLIAGKFYIVSRYPQNPPSPNVDYTNTFNATHGRTHRELTNISFSAPVYFHLIPERQNIAPSKRSKVVCA
ncbi:MAG: hypothetical protein DSY42_09740 [Aquifex sp.]|nr:MAG: hypothetical protein DSY42_09740 [Aquifex sp.]